MEKVLQLVFKKADGKQKVLNVTDPRENVTAEEARTAMQSEIPVSILTAVVGAPFFIYLLRRTGGISG